MPHTNPADRTRGFIIAALIVLCGMSVVEMLVAERNQFDLVWLVGTWIVAIALLVAIGRWSRQYERLVRSNERNWYLIDNNIDAIYVKDLDARYKMINTAGAAFMGRDVKDVLGRLDEELFDAETGRAIFESDRRVMLGGEVVHVTDVAVAAGVRRTYDSTKGPIYDKQGKLCGLFGISRDVTDLVEVEQRLRLAQGVVDGSRDVICVVNRELKLEMINDAYRELVGPEVAANKDLTLRDLLSPRDMEELVWPHIQEAFAGQRAQYDIGLSFSGGYQIWRVSYTPYAEDDGTIERVICVSHNVTDLLEKTAKYEAANRELEQFAYVASHDLQEPLRKIQAFGDRLADKYGDVLDERGQDYLARMHSAASRMQVLIQDLLALSRVTTKAEPFIDVSLEEVVSTVLEDLEIRINETEATVDVKPLPVVHGDPGQLGQLFQNLIANALKFRRPGVAPRVTISAADLWKRDERHGVEIRVLDNGIGFDTQYLPKIFQAFGRLHSRAEFEGTGIGLATCRKIVERHGGELTAESKPGEGATFIVRLPQQGVALEQVA